MDYFGPGKTIPHYELAADGVESPLTKLFHRLSLIGAKKPNIITINIDPSQIGEVNGCHSIYIPLIYTFLVYSIDNKSVPR